MEKINISEKFGQWFLDIAKYIVTAMILTTVFTDMARSWILAFAGLFLSASIIIAFVLFRIANNDSKTTKKHK